MPLPLPRSLSLAAVCLLAAALLTSCVEPVHSIRMSESTPTRVNASLAAGRSNKLHSGAPFAWWIWQDGDGQWHLRTTAARQGKRFRGRIHVDAPGAIVQLTPVGMENRRGNHDEIGMVDGDIALNFTTHQNVDGCDFRLTGTGCLEFDLRIDGDGDPGRIYLGSSQAQPPSAHFLLCP